MASDKFYQILLNFILKIFELGFLFYFIVINPNYLLTILFFIYAILVYVTAYSSGYMNGIYR